MSSNTLVESTIRKDTECGREMLLSVQSLFLERVEFGVSADLETLAAGCFAQGTHGAVVAAGVVEYAEGWCHVGWWSLV